MANEVSEREAQVLAALGAHLSNAQIANRLSISIRTVESHVSSLLRKLGAADRRELAALAMAGPGPAQGIRALPQPLTSFVGRDRERASVLAALAETRLVTLVGPGGVGKTRLAVVAAQEYGGVGGFVDLVPVREGQLTHAVATALGVTDQPQASLDQVIVDTLSREKFLLILDNCEHVLDEVTPFAERLLASCPGVRVLATSRHPLGIAGRTVTVPPLSLVSTATGGPAGSEAQTLFYDRVAQHDPEFHADPGAVRELCARLDGMPLAIELAAARCASLGADGLLAALADHLRALTVGRGADARHRSIRAVIDWSHDLLDEPEQALFRRLSIFIGGFDLAAAVAVDGGDAASTVEVFGRLVDKNLVAHQRRSAARRRWRLLETVRAYASERLSRSPELEDVRRAHAQWAMDTAADLESQLADGDGWQEEFDLVADDLRSAADTDVRLGRSLAHLLYARRFHGAAREMYVQCAERSGSSEDLRSAADVAMVEARGDLAYGLLLRAAEWAAAAGDARAEATCVAYAVTIAGRTPATFREAVPHARLVRQLDRATGIAPADDRTRAYLAAARAWLTATRSLGVTGEAARAALDAARTCGDPALESCALDAVWSATSEAGRHRDAYAVWRQRAALLPRLPRHLPGSGWEIFDTGYMGVEAALTAGDVAGALAWGEATRNDDIAGGLAHNAARGLVMPLVLLGRFDEAIEQAEQMWDGWQRAGGPAAGWMSPAVCSVAIPYGLRGDAQHADQWRHRARQSTGNPHDPSPVLVVFAVFVEARIALHLGRWDLAGQLAAEVLATSLPERTGAPIGTRYHAYAVAAAAELAAVAEGWAQDRIGRPDLLGAARAAAEQNDWAAACLARLDGRLGDRATLEEAVVRWERIGARFERACTLALLPDRHGEAVAEFAALAVPQPAG